MNNAEKYDVLVLGAGTAGKLTSWTMAREGKRTAAIERRYVGGACPNVACLPSKNVIHSAEVASLFARHEEFGIDTGSIVVKMAGVYARKRKMVDDLYKLHMDQFRASGAELIMGSGLFIGPRTIQVTLRDGGTRTLTGEQVFLNLGTHAVIPNIPGLAGAAPLTHIEALNLERLPGHLIVLGGGYVGVELAQAFRRFGSEVTVIARGSQILSREEPEVSDAVLQLFTDDGIGVVLNTEVMRVEGSSGKQVRVDLQTDGARRVLEGTDILVAVGREPNTKGVGLETAGVEVADTGYIRVNDRLETTAPNVWAMGECAGSPQFTHISEDDFNIIHANLNGGNRKTTNRLIPYCVFIDPQVARVGLNEPEARAAKIAYRVATVPITTSWRTWTTSEPRGFLKALIDDNDRIIGFTGFGEEAGELMGTVQVAMLAGQSYKLLADAAFAHPTMNEGLKALFSSVPQLAAAQRRRERVMDRV